MIVRKKDRVVVLGITGKQGTFWTEKMIAYGTNVVAGINPKRAGESHIGVPIFATTAEAAAKVGADVAVMFIPPPMAREAAVSAAEAGVKLLVVLTEHIPAQDVMAIHAAANKHGTRIVGPNTAGLVTPGECFVGIMPAFVPSVFKPGRVGVISRSGSLGTLVCLNLTRAGLGQSAFIGIGGDPDARHHHARRARSARYAMPAPTPSSSSARSAAAWKRRRPTTPRRMTKPMVAFIAGAAAPPNKKMGHAGAIVTGNAGSYASKRAALEAAGVVVVDTPSQIAAAVAAVSVPDVPAAKSPPVGIKENRVALPTPQVSRPFADTVIDFAPGVVLSAVVAGAAYLAAPYVGARRADPGHGAGAGDRHRAQSARQPAAVQPGMAFCVRTLLRWAVALLGLRVALSDIAALGLQHRRADRARDDRDAVVSGFFFARWSGRQPGFGALVGVATAVCGASATLATSTVVPDYPGKQADIAFVVVAVNALATLAMVIYPPLCILLGFDRADHRRDAGRHHPRRGAGGGRRLRRVRAGRQHRRDRQAVPRVPAAAGGARRRLVFHARRASSMARRACRCRCSRWCSSRSACSTARCR